MTLHPLGSKGGAFLLKLGLVFIRYPRPVGWGYLYGRDWDLNNLNVTVRRTVTRDARRSETIIKIDSPRLHQIRQIILIRKVSEWSIFYLA